jgi:hypothetical protein
MGAEVCRGAGRMAAEVGIDFAGGGVAADTARIALRFDGGPSPLNAAPGNMSSIGSLSKTPLCLRFCVGMMGETLRCEGWRRRR